MGWDQIAIVLVGALAGGFVSGLAGFGTGITAMGVWLYALPPGVVATMAAACSVIAQVQTIPAIWHTIEPRRVLPIILPGLVGVPIGSALLAIVDPERFKMGAGLLMIGFSLFLLLRRRPGRFTAGGRVADALMGFVSGILGGLAGLSGILPTMWANIRGWGRDKSRSVFQSYNLSILATSLVAHAFAGRLTPDVGLAVLTTMPATTIGAWSGIWVYKRLSDQRFRTIILVLLAVAGLGLVVSAR